ncbi:hypothetical protein [Parabacteroides goldsteinii]|nr:hypothetical protein [Parabacteroides goldsteinii]
MEQKITGSEALLKALIAEGVDTIFGYPGVIGNYLLFFTAYPPSF